MARGELLVEHDYTIYIPHFHGLPLSLKGHAIYCYQCIEAVQSLSISAPLSKL